ncbi:MAG: 30S ribosomal protein S17 [bacterium]|nr:30S ribosomal protein S17 [bacterium]
MKRTLQGTIVSDKMNKTRVVAVTRLKKHPIYHKYYKVTRKFKAHDEKNEYKAGEKVIIEETRPISKDKRWRIIGKQ